MQTFLEHQHFKLKLEYHDELNPALWMENDSLKPAVRDHLLAIATKYQDFAKIPADAIRDIIISGGNCNWNYTKDSDIDLHLVIDYADMPSKDPEFTKEYFMSKKDVWANKHNIRIMGYPVEVFAQDMNADKPAGQGSYSLLDDEWINKPEKIDPGYSEPDLEDRVKRLSKEITDAIKSGDGERAEELKDKISAKRAEALSGPNANEFAYHNEVFKAIRNRGLIDRLKKFISRKSDERFSLK
jgi:hypothetical protein